MLQPNQTEMLSAHPSSCSSYVLSESTLNSCRLQAGCCQAVTLYIVTALPLYIVTVQAIYLKSTVLQYAGCNAAHETLLLKQGNFPGATQDATPYSMQ